MTKECKDTKNVQDDYEFSRATYYNLIEKGQEGLEQMMDVARESEHPRAYEVLASMLKNISDINDKLMDLNKKHKDISQEEKQALPKGTTNNNLFIGSTTDLQRLLMQHNEKEVIEVDSGSTKE
tara:strand:+ start:462 stop:833 length:372 start_codon:yes stop_codon:yes gene_type:complete